MDALSTSLKMDEQRQYFVDSNQHCLVLGGPGSGKTTISLIKAHNEIAKGNLEKYQKILFLSFARATITRIVEASQILLDSHSRKSLDINTYHGFCWALLQSHGYLIGLNRKIILLSPVDAASHLADIRSNKDNIVTRKQEEANELKRLAFEEGKLSFDLFSELSVKLLRRHPKIAKIICDKYPLMIFDEFQDTDSNEWDLIQELGVRSTLITLADPDQRIFEFRGADQARIRQFSEKFKPRNFDFGIENNRSPGTDISDFGKDILTDLNKGKQYKDVKIIKWTFTYRSTTYTLKSKVIEACKRLNTKHDNWSLAVLVPTKKLMLIVSQALSENSNNLPPLYHSIAIDAEGPTLAARIIAYLLEPVVDTSLKLSELINMLSQFYRGKGGSNPGVGDLKESAALLKALDKATKSGMIGEKSIIYRADLLVQSISKTRFSGNPEIDWITIREMLIQSNCPRLKIVAELSIYIKLLGKGTHLREALATNWRKDACYSNAREIIENAFMQEHFSSSTKPSKGIIVMNMHKAKGKEFNEVILFEDQYNGRFYPKQSSIDQARINLRVSVTRAKERTTIMTPSSEPSILLF